MDITISRKAINDLYTMGELRINGLHQTYTVEATEIMLPAGQYIIRIVKHSARKQSICIFDPGEGLEVRGEGNSTNEKSLTPNPSPKSPHPSPLTHFSTNHSWIGSKKTRSIVIGTPLIPGAMYKGIPDYERITDRLMKCTARHEPILLTISDSGAIHNQPIRHWLEPSTH